MKKIILSRDTTDKQIFIWLSSMGFEILPPGTKADSWIDGIVIAGGLAPHDDPERDAIEFELVNTALREKIPFLGICRGMEVLVTALGGSIKKMSSQEIDLHKYKWHAVSLSNHFPIKKLDVWSNHVNEIDKFKSLNLVGVSLDGKVEALINEKDRLLGVLWHPEKSNQEGYSSIYPWLKWVEKRF